MTWKSHIDLIYVVNIRDYNVTHHKKIIKQCVIGSTCCLLLPICMQNEYNFFVLYDISNSDLGFVYLCVCGMI